ncbi:MAG: tetratricopeptide repeat protein, partial [Cyanobacteria bacterium J06635_10]
AIEINPKFPQIYLNRSLVRRNLKDYQGSIGDLTKAIEINPNFAQAYYNRGIILVSLGDKKQAIADLHKAVSLFQKQGRQAKVKEV